MLIKWQLKDSSIDKLLEILVLGYLIDKIQGLLIGLLRLPRKIGPEDIASFQFLRILKIEN